MGLIRPATALSERYILSAFALALGEPAVEEIQRSDIERWLSSIGHVAAATRRSRFSTVRTFFHWLLDAGVIDRSPFVGIPAPKVPKSRHRSLRHDQAAALLAECRDARSRCVVLLGLQLGLRRAEIAQLEVGDVDPEARVVNVVGKGGHERVVPLTVEAEQAIESYLRTAPAKGGPLIRNDRFPSRPVKPAWVGRLITALAYDAGVKVRARDGVSTHALRHTAATDTYRACRDVMVVRDLLGHASLATTQIYVRGLEIEALRAAIEGRSYAA